MLQRQKIYQNWQEKLCFHFAAYSEQEKSNFFFLSHKNMKLMRKIRNMMINGLTIHSGTQSNSQCRIFYLCNFVETALFCLTLSPINVRLIAYVQKWELTMTKTIECVMVPEYDVHLLFSSQLFKKSTLFLCLAEVFNAFIYWCAGKVCVIWSLILCTGFEI